MFDIGFWELVVIAIVALIVFGPERLPQFARRAGYWIGRARRQIHTIRAEIEREIALDEIEQARHKLETPLNGLAQDIRKASSFDSRDAGTLASAAKTEGRPSPEP